MKHIRSTFFLLTTLFIMASCGEDRSGEYYALIGENVWIEQIMKEHYLWYDSIPAIKETDYFAEPENFLQTKKFRRRFHADAPEFYARARTE